MFLVYFIPLLYDMMHMKYHHDVTSRESWLNVETHFGYCLANSVFEVIEFTFSCQCRLVSDHLFLISELYFDTRVTSHGRMAFLFFLLG